MRGSRFSETSQERLSSGLKALPLSASSGGENAAGLGGKGDAAEEAPLDSLLASKAKSGLDGRSKAHQASYSIGTLPYLFCCSSFIPRGARG